MSLLTDIEMDLMQSLPVVCHEPTWARLQALGVTGVGVNGRNAFDALAVDETVFRKESRFDFARDAGYGGHVAAVIIPVWNECCDLVDLAAWHIGSGRIATLRGHASMLGGENIFRPRLGEPLKVYESMPDWLRAGREGVFVLDGERASPLLRMAEPLGVRTQAFGRRLRASLSIRSPRIVVANPGRAAA